ncbi:unnamed protein product [Arctia plantaginis]|uniref:Uncharacterized protein n=1 Tax=Arctia plantaginis TaxID=874455 RepID=A0A8S1ALF3_ARCPL|nr:unnamed protein product [Arctia plantaginis]
MTACRISTCSNEACGENDKKDDESRIKTPYHKPSIFTPPLSLCDRIKLLKRKCVRAINIVYAASRKIYYNDRFTWQLLKSSILFVLVYSNTAPPFRDHYSTHILRLERIQKRFMWHLAFTVGIAKTSKKYEERLSFFKLLSLEKRITLLEPNLFYKLLHNHLDCSVRKGEV